MSTRVIVAVSKEHINFARTADMNNHGSANTCPVGLALCDALRVKLEQLTIYNERAFVREENKIVRVISLPKWVGKRIADFCATGEMEPFGFTIHPRR